MDLEADWPRHWRRSGWNWSPKATGPEVDACMERSLARGFLVIPERVPLNKGLDRRLLTTYWDACRDAGQFWMYLHFRPGDRLVVHYDIECVRSHPEARLSEAFSESAWAMLMAYYDAMPRAAANRLHVGDRSTRAIGFGSCSTFALSSLDLAPLEWLVPRLKEE